MKIEKFIKNAKTSSKPRAADFNWESQLKWEQGCKSEFSQSPINIETADTIVSQQVEFSVNYNFLDTNVKIEKRFTETVIRFTNNPGLITLTKAGTSIIYMPKYISFRFPGEHMVLGKKYNGEMQIHCREVNKDRKRRVSNGLIITIPLDNDIKNHNLDTLESLNLDYWKFQLKDKNNYIPKDFASQQQNVFHFSNIMYIIKKSLPNFYFYIGSNTVPPCQENVYHLIVNAPLKISNCQFKLLRDNSLFTDKFQAVHARLTQPKNKRKVYVLTNNNIQFKTYVENLIPKDMIETANQLEGKPLLPKKLSTVTKLKALKATKKLVKNGGKLTKKLKYDKKGVKIIRNGLNVKKIALKKFGKNALKLPGKGKKGQSILGKNILEKGVSAGEYHAIDNDAKEHLNC